MTQSAQPPDYHHWQYFLALENDLINVSRYIEFSGVDNREAINARVHSMELLRIFFAACAESENILKILAPRPSTISGDYNIRKIKNELQAHHLTVFNQLITTTIQLPIFNISFTPWQDWRTEGSPKWWSRYNWMKHRRTTFNPAMWHYKLANLHNTLNAVSGLMCLLLHHYTDTTSSEFNLPLSLVPKLFEPKPPNETEGGTLTVRFWWL
ncbi:MAG: hypothetical protein ACRCU2_30485 [Planktothrix sp.]